MGEYIYYQNLGVALIYFKDIKHRKFLKTQNKISTVNLISKLVALPLKIVVIHGICKEVTH